MMKTSTIAAEMAEKLANDFSIQSKSLLPDATNNYGTIKSKRSFDMSKYRQRKIALHVQYDGGAYLGFASQAEGESDNTVEKHIFAALKKVCLISDRNESGYSRCGRTDKGVSALGQIVALNLRSALPQTLHDNELPHHPNDSINTESSIQSSNKKKNLSSSSISISSSPEIKKSKELLEIDYCTVLNKCLPMDIRILGWTEVSAGFSARFSATHRTYRYFFLRRNLDINAMKSAAQLLLGSHDFRNLSKLDVANVSNFVREVISAEILPVNDEHYHHQAMYMFEITGVAFLWHMVRSIMAVLLLVGDHKEQPEIISQLLDVTSMPTKPQYEMAPDNPLVLHKCGFDNLSMQYQPTVLWSLCSHFEAEAEKHLISAARANNALQDLRHKHVRRKDARHFMADMMSRHSVVGASGVALCGDDGEVAWSDVEAEIAATGLTIHSVGKGRYIPLLERKRGDSYETRRANLSGGKRLRSDRHEGMKAKEQSDDRGGVGCDDDGAGFFARMRREGSRKRTKDEDEDER